MLDNRDACRLMTFSDMAAAGRPEMKLLEAFQQGRFAEAQQRPDAQSSRSAHFHLPAHVARTPAFTNGTTDCPRYPANWCSVMLACDMVEVQCGASLPSIRRKTANVHRSR
jgi:hypothetical protein